MKRTTILGLAAALLAGMLLLQAGEAFARAGSGGSRGSKSSSAPARPAPMSPTTPSSPSRSTVSPAPTAPQPARGGWMGGLMGGLAGFALGGLLGSMLFGGGFGSGFGGFGLFELLLVGGGLFLLYRFMKARRAQQPAYATPGGARYDGEPGGTTTVMEAPAAPQSDLDRGIAHIRSMDAGFDPAAVAASARGIFTEVQQALTAREMSAVAAKLTSRMYTELTSQCDRLRAARRTNRMDAIDIRRAEATEAWQESGADYVTIYLTGSLVDYTIDDTTGDVVEGSRAPQEFEEFWTFTRQVGPNPWRLSAIQTA